MTDETTELKAIMDEFEHECYMLRAEASETRARDDVVRKSYERIRDEFAGRIAATLGDKPRDKTEEWLLKACNQATQDYVAQLERERDELKGKLEAATLGGGMLTAEQVKRIHEIIEKHWHDLPSEYDMPEATALPEYSYDWQAIADELNDMLGDEPNPDGLPNGLTISDDGTLLNWRGENYVKQNALRGGTLTAEQVREAIYKHGVNDGSIYSVFKGSFKAIADELNAELGSGTCKWTWVEEWTDTDAGRECDYAHWTLDCGCWDVYDEHFQDFDDYESKPKGIGFCERCGKAVAR